MKVTRKDIIIVGVPVFVAAVVTWAWVTFVFDGFGPSLPRTGTKKRAVKTESISAAASSSPKKAHSETVIRNSAPKTEVSSTEFSRIPEKRVEPMIEVGQEEANKILPLKAGVEPMFSFTLEKGTIKNLNVGDTFVFPEMDGEVIETLIVDKKVESDGSVYVRGGNPGEEDPLKRETVVFSEGKKFAFITVNFQGKQYEGETKDGVGHFYRTSDIKSAWIDSDKGSDVVLPPHDLPKHITLD